tara:strand:- start:685 stop:1317 length:633 start_codon:yes stop_codon:yes gene_type:complete
MPHETKQSPSQDYEARQYESFGRLRIDSGNPELGNDGATVYALVADGKSGNTSYLGMSEGGQYHIFNDQCFNIVAGVKKKGTGAGVNIAANHGDICITCQSNGTVKISGQNITIDAEKHLQFKADTCQFDVTSQSGIQFNTPRMNTNAKRGNLVRNVDSFMGVCFANTKVGMDEVSSVLAQVPEIDVSELQAGAEQAAQSLQGIIGGFNA